MHELAVTQLMVEQLVEECRKRAVTSVKTVTVEVGRLTTYKEEPITYYFNLLRENYPEIAKTSLKITLNKGKLKCNKCDKESIPNEDYALLCPCCGSNAIEILEGNDLKIKEMETND